MKNSPSMAARVCAPVAVAVALATAAFDATAGDFYVQHNLVSDGSINADHTDANLKNPWGIVFNPAGPVWVANNGTGTATLYDGDGNAVPLVVQIPGPANATTPGVPTGVVFNGGTAFIITKSNVTGAARFIFATEDGTLAGWAPNVDMTHAITMIDNSKGNAVYKGLAMTGAGNGSLLYATDFHNNRVDVFDSNFKQVTLSGKFADPSLPPGFAVFGIQAIGGNLYVSYAVQDAEKKDDVKGAGLGIINVFDPNGNLLQRLATAGPLNSPWGMVLAPAGFGHQSNRLLVGNFGDGHINVFNLSTGTSEGQLCDGNNSPIVISGLWGLAFGNGFAAQPVNTLFFAAGINEEKGGLYGRITLNANSSYSPTKDCGGTTTTTGGTGGAGGSATTDGNGGTTTTDGGGTTTTTSGS